MQRLIPICLAGLMFAGCATLAPPADEKLNRLPVVRFGDAVPTGEFILHFPAGQPIPVTVAAGGNLFTRDVNNGFSVVLKQDVYEYREWASLDRVHWIRGDQLVDFKLALKVPSYRHPRPGLIRIDMNFIGERK